MAEPAYEIVSGAEFRERLETEERVLALFFARWCGFSRAFLPAFDAFSREADVPAVAVDLSDEEDPWWDHADVEAVPTLVAYEDGAETARLDGVPGAGIPPRAFSRFVNEHFAEEIGP